MMCLEDNLAFPSYISLVLISIAKILIEFNMDREKNILG